MNIIKYLCNFKCLMAQVSIEQNKINGKNKLF